MKYINKLIATADSETIIKFVEHMLPKVKGEGKVWQEKALDLWRPVVTALCYMRDNDIPGRERLDVKISTIIDNLSLDKVGELYIIGREEAQTRPNGDWSDGFSGIKAYLDNFEIKYRYKVEILLANRDQLNNISSDTATKQDPLAYEQHAYLSSQLMPALNLLRHIFYRVISDPNSAPILQYGEMLITTMPKLKNTYFFKANQDNENITIESIGLNAHNIMVKVQESDKPDLGYTSEVEDTIIKQRSKLGVEILRLLGLNYLESPHTILTKYQLGKID